MRVRDLPSPIVIIVGLFLLVAWLVRGYLFPSATIYADFLTALAIIFSVIVAYVGYTFTRRRDSQNITENKREEFVKSESLARIRMLIEHNDIELQTVVMILNIAEPYEYDPDTLPRKYWELHREFDQYLDFLEGVSILRDQGNVFPESVKGLWRYYSIRLMQVDTLDVGTNAVKRDQIEECMDKIYDGNVPNRIKNAWQNAVKEHGEQEVYEPITHKCINPVEKPIWHYMNRGRYQFEPLIRMICELSGQKVKLVNGENNSWGQRLLGWIEYGARFIVWASVLGFAILTVLGTLPILPEPTSIGLLVLLYIFIVAALVQWIFDMKRLYPPKRKRD